MINRNSKSIKKTYKIVLLLMVVMLSLPTIGYIALRQDKVQQFLVNKITTKLSTFFGTRISVTSAKIDLLSNITFSNFCVQSPKKDTILFTKELSIKFNAFTLTSRFFEIKQVKLLNPVIHFYIDSTKTINFQFIVDKLTSRDTIKSTKNGWIVSIKEIDLINADFTLKAFDYVPREYGINFTDLQFRPFSMKVTNFRINSGNLDMRIRSLSGVEKSGFVINDFSSRVKINKQLMAYNDLFIKTGYSEINAKQAKFTYESLKDFRPGIFGKKVKLGIDFKSSKISTRDIEWFTPMVKDYNIQAVISGNIKGSINELKGKDIEISYGNHTKIKANFDINGLPAISSTFLHIDIKNLYTNPIDIESIRLPKSKNGRVVLPENFKRVSFLTYRGKFTGFTNDFVAYGTITSNLGRIESDLSLKPDTAHSLKFKGQLKSYQFDIGKFINKSDLIGQISLNAMVNGNISHGKDINAKMNGLIQSFYVKKYNYQNINVNGTLSNNTYDGSVSIADPNITLDFLGKVNLSNQMPIFNFTANVKGANLYKLNLDAKDSTSFLQFYITADFEGTNIDNLNGEIKLWNSTIRRGKKEIHVNDLLLFTKTINNSKQIILRSDLADAELIGKYRFSQLANSIKLLTKNYLPSLIPENLDSTESENNFKFEIDFKNSRELTDFFVSGLYISKDSKLTGNFNPAKKDLNFLLKIPIIQHLSKKWYNVYFDGKTNRSTFSLLSGCKNLKLNNSISLDNFTISSDIRHDSIQSNLRWNNWDSVVYKGNFSILSFLKSEKNHDTPKLKIKILPSQLILKDTLWSIKTDFIEIDTSNIRISNFEMSHNDQLIRLYGAISGNPRDDISLELTKVNLGNLRTVFSPKKLTIDGVINGKATVSNVYKNPVFHALLVVDSLAVNNESIGKTNISAIYNNAEKTIGVEAKSERGSLNTLTLKGIYAVQDKTLDFSIDLNKLKLDVFEPYIAIIFTDVRGIASGALTLTGNIKAPVLNGNVKIQKASFMVNYLKTRYNFTHVVEVKNNTFLFKNIEVFDSKSNKAIANGQIEYRNLKELNVDIDVEAKNFECLNTSLNDNSMFYGQGFASGNVRIISSPKDGVSMDIEATSSPKTNISIPLGTKMELTESNFIKFKAKEKEIQPLDQYEIDKVTETAKSENAGANMNLNILLHITPDAIGQIVFDEKIGDKIKGTGSGDITMTLKNGIFNMDGIFNIEQGDYLFTAGGIIYKNFIIEPGGTISWYGNPLDATIDIQAAYNRLKTSLYQLTNNTSGDQKKVEVDCRMFLTGKLMNPSIRYDIYLPNSDQETRNIVSSYTNTQEDMSNQFLALLITNNFYPNQGSSSATSSAAASVTGIEFLSNQLSRMMSQFSKDFDIGFNYRRNDFGTTGQVEMALSTQLLNDRIIINGNVDVGGQQVGQLATNSSNTGKVIGEGNVEVKLTNNGKLRLKAYNRANQSYISEYPYTQGVGILYKEDFNSINELFKHYYKLIFTRKEEQPKPMVEDTTD